MRSGEKGASAPNQDQAFPDLKLLPTVDVLLLNLQCTLALREAAGYDSREVGFNPGSYFTSLVWKRRVDYFFHSLEENIVVRQ